MDHVGGADGVFVGPGFQLRANVREACVFRTAAFVGQDEAAVTAVVDAVVKGGADGAVGVFAASGESGLEFCGDVGPDGGAGGGLSGEEGESCG